MNPSVSITVAGDMATKWRRFAAVTIAQPVGFDKDLECLSGKLLNHLNHLRFRIDGVVRLSVTV
jgi:hypothetical protein